MNGGRNVTPGTAAIITRVADGVATLSANIAGGACSNGAGTLSMWMPGMKYGVMNVPFVTSAPSGFRLEEVKYFGLRLSCDPNRTPSVGWGRALIYQPSNQAFCSLCFAGSSANLLRIAESLTTLGLVGTFYLQPDAIGMGKLSWDDARAIRQMGHAVSIYCVPRKAGSGKSVKYLDATASERRDAIIAGKATLEAHGLGGVEIGFIQGTGGGGDPMDETYIDGVIADHCGFGMSSADPVQPKPLWNPRACYGYSWPHDTSPIRRRLVTAAEDTGGVCGWMFHGCDGPTYALNTNDIPFADLLADLEWLAGERNAGKITVGTPSDLLYGNLPKRTSATGLSAILGGEFHRRRTLPPSSALARRVINKAASDRVRHSHDAEVSATAPPTS